MQLCETIKLKETRSINQTALTFYVVLHTNEKHKSKIPQNKTFTFTQEPSLENTFPISTTWFYKNKKIMGT